VFQDGIFLSGELWFFWSIRMIFLIVILWISSSALLHFWLLVFSKLQV
jgi:hypothetical protein